MGAICIFVIRLMHHYVLHNPPVMKTLMFRTLLKSRSTCIRKSRGKKAECLYIITKSLLES